MNETSRGRAGSPTSVFKTCEFLLLCFALTNLRSSPLTSASSLFDIGRAGRSLGSSKMFGTRHVPNLGPHYFLDHKEYVLKLRMICNETSKSRHHFVVEDCRVVHVSNEESYESRYRSIRTLIDRALSLACPPRLRKSRFEFCVLTDDIEEDESRATSILYDVPVFAPAATKTQIGHLIPAPDHVFVGWPEARSGIENYTDFYERCRGDVGAASRSTAGKDDDAIRPCQTPWSSRRQQLVWVGMPTHEQRVKYINALQQHGDFANVTIGFGRTQFINQAAAQHVLDVRGNGYSGRTPLLFLLGSTVWLDVDSPYIRHFTPMFVPWVHYVPVRLATLNKTIEWARSNPRKCEEISRNGQELAFSLFNPDNIARTWSLLLQRLALFVAPDFESP